MQTMFNFFQRNCKRLFEALIDTDVLKYCSCFMVKSHLKADLFTNGCLFLYNID